MADFALMLATQDIRFKTPGFKEFLLHAYIERGFSGFEDSTEAIGVIKRMVHNIEISM